MGSATPAADMGAMLIMEMVLHGWDIARATGQDYHCDEQLARASWKPSRPRPICSASTRASPPPCPSRMTHPPSTTRWACPAATPTGSQS